MNVVLMKVVTYILIMNAKIIYFMFVKNLKCTLVSVMLMNINIKKNKTKH